MFKALFAALLAVGAAAPVVAAPITYSDHETVDDHIELLRTIESLGVTLIVNDHLTCTENPGTAGYWHGRYQRFALCQQKLRHSENPLWTGNVVMASDDDLDTIRHEAHHIVQDCIDGELDGYLSMYFNDDRLVEFLDGYPDWKEHKIYKLYEEQGASPETIKLEIEAWAVADMVDAKSITRVVKEVCVK